MKHLPEGFYVNRHSCFILQYHLVLVTKYRHPVITGELEKRLIEFTENYFKERDCRIQEIECMPDHMHILFDAPPQINLANYINAYKSASSRRIRQEYGKQLEPYYWKPYFWSLSYFISSVSDRNEEITKEYIQNQKDKAFTNN